MIKKQRASLIAQGYSVDCPTEKLESRRPEKSGRTHGACTLTSCGYPCSHRQEARSLGRSTTDTSHPDCCRLFNRYVIITVLLQCFGFKNIRNSLKNVFKVKNLKSISTGIIVFNERY